jgi:hypothetical protein
VSDMTVNCPIADENKSINREIKKIDSKNEFMAKLDAF